MNRRALFLAQWAANHNINSSAFRNEFWEVSFKWAINCNGKRKASAISPPDLLPVRFVTSLRF